jgi:hypothetical protein
MEKLEAKSATLTSAEDKVEGIKEAKGMLSFKLLICL